MLIKKEEFFSDLDKCYDEWYSKTFAETKTRCEEAISTKLSNLKELANQGYNFGTLEKEKIQTDEIIICGNDILKDIQSELKGSGYDITIAQNSPSSKPYGSDIKIKIVIQ